MPIQEFTPAEWKIYKMIDKSLGVSDALKELILVCRDVSYTHTPLINAKRAIEKYADNEDIK